MRAVVALLCLVSISCQTRHPARRTEIDWLQQGQLAPPPLTPVTAMPRPFVLGPVNPVSFMMLADYLDNAGKANAAAVTIHINSPGGSVISALAIMQAIENAGRPVHCIVDGMAASAAFVILQACTTRVGSKRSLLMIHEASVSGEIGGGVNEFINVIEFLRVINATMVTHCAARMGLSEAAFAEKISGGKEYWLTAKEALTAHALDSIK